MAGTDISINNTSAIDTSIYNNDANNASAYNISAFDASAYNTSAYNTSAYNTSADNTSAYEIGAYNSSAYNISYETNTNNTSTYNSTFYSSNEEDSLGVNIYYYVLFGLCMVAFIYGLVSWYMVKKFRHFKNYVFLNVILANSMRLLSGRLSKSIFAVCLIAFQCWLVVLCYIFYMDFVKVFSTDIRRKYLKTGLFAYGLPFLLLSIPAIYGFIYGVLGYGPEINSAITYLILSLVFLIYFTPAAVNLGIYIVVICSLFRTSEAGATTSSNKWRRFYIATLIFLFSNILSAFYLLHFVANGTVFTWIGALGDLLHTTAFDVYFMIMKSNRELWRQYFKRRSIRTSLELR